MAPCSERRIYRCSPLRSDSALSASTRPGLHKEESRLGSMLPTSENSILLGNSVNKPPAVVAHPSRWHHALIERGRRPLGESG